MLTIDVTKQLGTFRLEASLQLGSGVTALFGPSGSGKTSVIQTVAGLSKPDTGRIEMDGKVLFDAALGINLPPKPAAWAMCSRTDA